MNRICTFSLTALLLLAGCKKDKPASMDTAPTPKSLTSTEAAANEATSPETATHTGFVALAPTDTALQMDGLRLSLGELLAILDKLHALPAQNEMISAIVPKMNGLTENQQKAARAVLYRLVRQQLLLREARSENLSVTEYDRQAFAKRWEEQNPEGNFQQYLDSLPMTASTPLSLTRDDIFLLYKWGEKQLSEIDVPEEDVQRALNQMKQIEQAFGKQAEDERNAFAALADNADLYTDAGFAKLAREHSEGSEAERGGVIDRPMTRAEIAAANFDQPFTVPTGETSALIETPTSLRFIRVLEELPATMPGEPARLRIAQILYAKKELDNLPTEEQIRVDLKYQTQEKFIGEKLERLGEKFHFNCPLFPDLLDIEKLNAAPVRESPSETDDDK